MPISSYDAIIIDINMPVMNGRELVTKIRENSITTPILILTSEGEIDSKVSLFELGADDYVTKPFDMREIEARLLVLSRRPKNLLENEIILGDIIISLSRHSVTKNSEIIELTAKEYAILEFLARHRGFPKTKTDILEAVW